MRKNYKETRTLTDVIADTFATVEFEGKKYTLQELKAIRADAEHELRRLSYRNKRRDALKNELYDIEDAIDEAQLSPGIKYSLMVVNGAIAIFAVGFVLYCFCSVLS
ncbi:MAG TPA: hypothetical protein VM577_15510 [Anaerovoracaceae bacterium]|nr:hypothetical protein [Anaerovoracaceae bacterium]